MSRIRLTDYPRTFWVANGMELFERAAYYGLNSVLGVYLRDVLAFRETAVGFLQSLVYAAVYVIPILGGALADRYGYRRMLMFAFSLLSAGYFAAGYTSSYALIFLCLLVMATGAGLFKPIISGTIARTTDERTSSVGFAIYYWMINVGAAVSPLIVTWLKGRFSWQAVFTASALYTAAMLLPAIFLYREPPRPENTRKFRDVVAGAAEVLGDARFVLMIVLYSGFWVLYFQQFSTVLWYLRDCVDRGPVDRFMAGLGLTNFHFDAEHVTFINAFTIIALQIVISWVVKDRPALTTMIAGMLLGALGLAFLAVSFSPWWFILGMVVFSIGEVTGAPKYYSFVGLYAPADRKAVYLGYGFLYGVFGSLIGSNLGAMLYNGLIKPSLGRPDAHAKAALFWGILVVIDLAAAAGLWLAARRFSEDTETSRRHARFVMIGVYAGLVVLGPLFVVVPYLQGAEFDIKSTVQAGIFVLLGLAGLAIVVRGKRPGAPVAEV